ncbi:PQQ-dependent sugar dehydrogenase [Pseudoxanthomonas sacheonensis]|uniref:Glucose/arabinose dehydrogenase n=1 Tax=Pseudoxanthomonas sacheonensis TaxID=443615 RepID=A0ABU1RNG6_9GAMM|nr:PQQ-dependent sugar dehydrogenase [Pseudoxanthomonas sacheonensis]MDR6840308.1 glucose/arabinose dehydrogenase [Pseudoxanthomonas sacheonensis]
MRILAVLLLLALSACGDKEPVSPAAQPRTVQAAPSVHESEKGNYAVTELVAGLEHPWGLAFLPGGDMLVTERPGRLRRISKAGQVSAPITGLPDFFVDGQAGLLDVAISPTFASDNLVYLSYAEPNLRGNKAGTAVVRGRLQDGALQDTQVVYRQEPKLSHGTHVGSRLVFDDAGHLFVTQGDNRVAAAAAQELDKLQGKLVRIWPDGRIPDDNPFVKRADARGEIWSYGHRNMQGAALHPVTRQIWTSEHGPMGGDELNIPQAGRNYGWPVITHGIDYSGEPVPGSVGKSAPGMEQPHHVWAVSPGLSGMAFYTGDLFPQWKGNLFLGSLAQSELIRLELDGDKVMHEERLLGALKQRIRDVRQGPDGALYVLTDEVDGKLLRITPAVL